MANIPLKTIKFPKLDNTYTVPEIDNTLTVTGKAADAKKVGDEVSAIKADLSELEDYTGTLVENKYISKTNGSINDGAGINYVEFPVSEGVTVCYRFTVSSSTTYGIAFYGDDGGVISSFQALTTPQTFSTPAQAVLCRATVNNKEDVFISNYNGWIYETQRLASQKIDRNTHKTGTNFINPATSESGYLNSSGKIVVTSSWHNTGLIELEENTQYYYSGLYNGGYYGFYDSTGSLLSVGTETLANPFTIPLGAKFGRFSKNGVIDNNVWINTKNEVPPAYAEAWTLDYYLKKDQGLENSGKVLIVGNDGKVTTNGDIAYSAHDPSTNYINPDNVSNGFINANGNAQTSSNWHNTGYVPLEAGKQYYYSGLYNGSSGYYAFYAADKSVVSVGSSDLPNPFTVPNGAVYGRFSKNGEITSSQWIFTENSTPPAYGTMLESAVFLRKNQGASNAGKTLVVGDDGIIVPKSNEVEFAEIELWQKGNLYKETDLVANKYIYKTGNESSYNNYYCTPFLPVSGYVYLNGFLNTYYAFYNESKTLVASYDTLGDIEQWTPGIKRVAVPTGAVYGRFSSHNLPSSYAFISCEPENPLPYDRDSVKDAYPLTFNPENPCDCESGSVTLFHKVVCIGDSLTWGAFNTDGDETINIPSANTLHEWYSYPTYFTKITGVETTNMGDSSETFKTWYELYGNADFSGHDCAIIHLGVNDASFDKSDEETAEYLCKIVDALKASVMGIKIFVCTVTPVFSNDRFPTHKQKSQVIRDTIAENYGDDPDVVLVDIERYSYVRQYTSYAAGHFTALGYWRFAKDVSNFISWHIDHYMRDYRFVQFIGSDRTYSGD